MLLQRRWRRGRLRRPRNRGTAATLEVGTVHVTIGALSWDQGDWPWKFNHDAGQMYEGLMAADLNQSKGRGGKYPFTSFAFLPGDAIRGELAESWEWETPMRLVIKLRKGVMFPEKPGVMAAREFVADDVIFAQNRMAKSPKQVGDLYDFIDKTTARDKHTLVYDLKEYVADWDLRLGWGFTTAYPPKEVVDAGAANWKNANGIGPFRLTDYVAGNSHTYEKNPIYWGKETINEAEYKLPFIDKVTFRIIKDQSTQITALRTGKLDILETINWENVETLKKSSPDLKWTRVIGSPHQLALRMDTKPFDDIRVRKALNIAVDKESLVKEFYGGNAEMLGFPMHPDWTGYYEPLEQMPDDIKELFRYDVARRRSCWPRRAYADGFTFKVQVCACSPVSMDLLAVLASYYRTDQGQARRAGDGVWRAPVGDEQQHQRAGLPSHDRHGEPVHDDAGQLRQPHVQPVAVQRPGLCREVRRGAAERDEAKRHAMFREMARDALRGVPMVFLPAPHYFIGLVAVGEELQRRNSAPAPPSRARSTHGSGSIRN